MADNLFLRDIQRSDLSVFFTQQLDPKANWMAAFTAKDPSDIIAFDAHWHKIMTDDTILIQTVVVDGEIAGSVLSYEEEGRMEISYWLGRKYWGKGIATEAAKRFLQNVNKKRPIFARAAKDNLGSLRVLEKCGFVIESESVGFANARGKEIEEVLLVLR